MIAAEQEFLNTDSQKLARKINTFLDKHASSSEPLLLGVSANTEHLLQELLCLLDDDNTWRVPMALSLTWFLPFSYFRSDVLKGRRIAEIHQSLTAELNASRETTVEAQLKAIEKKDGGVAAWNVLYFLLELTFFISGIQDEIPAMTITSGFLGVFSAYYLRRGIKTEERVKAILERQEPIPDLFDTLEIEKKQYENALEEVLGSVGQLECVQERSRLVAPQRA